MPMLTNSWRATAAALAVTLTLGGVAGNCRAADADAAAPEFAQVPADAAFVASIRWGDLWNNEALRPGRDKWLKDAPADAASFKDFWGVDMADADRLTIAAGLTEGVAFLTTTKPYDPKKMQEFLAKRTKEEKLGDHQIYVLDEDRAIYLLDERTVATGSPAWVRALAKRNGPAPKGVLTPALRPGAEKHLVLVAWDAAALAAGTEPPFPEFAPLMKAQLAVLTADLSGREATGELRLTFATEAEAKDGKKGVLQTRDKFLEAMKWLKDIDAGPDTDKVKASLAEIETSLKALDVVQDGSSVKADVKMKIDPAATAEAILKLYEQGNKEKH
jgi:hypothetical protein